MRSQLVVEPIETNSRTVEPTRTEMTKSHFEKLVEQNIVRKRGEYYIWGGAPWPGGWLGSASTLSKAKSILSSYYLFFKQFHIDPYEDIKVMDDPETMEVFAEFNDFYNYFDIRYRMAKDILDRHHILMSMAAEFDREVKKQYMELNFYALRIGVKLPDRCRVSFKPDRRVIR
jgi:hypothetical protein